MSQQRIDGFFKKAATIDETIPSRWLTDPLPQAPKKKPVGRPKKNADESPRGHPGKRPRDVDLDFDHSPAKRGKYKQYSMAQKREIVELAALHGVVTISKSMSIPKSTISTWKGELAKEDVKRLKSGRKEGSGKKPVLGDMEEELHTWVLSQREQHLPVSIETLCHHALSLAVSKDIEFKASRGWARRFTARRKLSLRCSTTVSQRLPADVQHRVSVFHRYLGEVQEGMEFEPGLVINMDEVPMVFDLLPAKTLHTRGDKDVKIISSGAEKKHFTVVLAVTADGRKLPSMIIFKGKRNPDVTSPPGWVVTANPTGWMKEEVMLLWIKEVLRPFTERRPALLIMDSFTAHTTEMVNTELRRTNATAAIIPGGCTSLAQPLDVSLNKPFKGHLRRLWSERMRSSVEAIIKAGGSIDQIQTSPKEQVLQWIHDAWTLIPPEMIRRSFDATGINAALRGEPEDLSNPFLDSDEESEGEEFLGFTPDDINDRNPFRDCM